MNLWTIDNAQGQQMLTRALQVAKVERQRRFAAANELERASTRLQVLEPMTSGTAARADEFLSIAAAVRHEAKVGKLLDEDKYPEAEILARRWLTEVEAKSGPDSLATARALDVLANALFVVKVADIPEKKQLAERALAIREKSLEPQDLEVAQSLYTLARVLWQAGEYRDARLYWERALSIREKALGPNHAAVRIVLANLSAVLADMGDCSASLPLAERFSALVEKAYGPDHPFFGRSLSVIYRAYYCAGNFTEARRVTEHALAIKEKAWGANNASVASDRANLGQLLWEIGDIPEAKLNYELALPVFEKLYGAESVPYADGLSGLARVAASSGDYPTAKTLQERVVTIYEKALGPNHSELGTPLLNLAVTLARMGEPERARPFCERALRLWEQSRGSESPFVAVALSRLAGLLREAGDLVWAKQLYERALAIQEKTYGAHHATVADTLRGLAQIEAMSGENQEALALATRAEEIGREHWQLIATTLSEREALAYSKERSSSLDLALTLAVQEKQTARSAWSAVVRSRALVLDEMAARHRAVSGAADPELARLADALSSARERQARLVVQGPSKENAEYYHKLLDDTRQEKERAERVLAERSQTFREMLARTHIGFDEVAAALPSNSALVAYVRYRHHDFTPTKPGGKHVEPTPHYLAFVWRHPKAEPRIVQLGPAVIVETLVTTMRRQIAQESQSGGRAAKRSEAGYRSTGARLRRTVWDPILPYVGNARSVFIVPDGALHLVNFSALPTGTAG
jgi:tetratricopeptide (TPR) repeat protein